MSLSVGTRLRIVKQVSLAIGVLSVIYISTASVINSRARRSVLGGENNSDINERLAVGESLNDRRLKLSEFHRIEIKNGAPLWEIRAKTAEYLADQGVIYVNNSKLRFYSKDDSEVVIESESARLHFTGVSVNQAELEGKVSLALMPSLLVATDYAVFYASAHEVIAPGGVKVSGKGFDVEGEGLNANIEERSLTLSRKVKSSFSPGEVGGKSLKLPQI